MGGYHAVVLAVDGAVWVWGHNRAGQLGVSDNFCTDDCILKTPAPLAQFPRFFIVSASAGWGNTVLLTSNNEILICGRNCSGQLGIPVNACDLNDRGAPCSCNFVTLCSGENVKNVTSTWLGTIVEYEDKTILWGEARGAYEWWTGDILPSEKHVPVESQQKLIWTDRSDQPNSFFYKT